MKCTNFLLFIGSIYNSKRRNINGNKRLYNKNLPNLNWNILPQIFEENEVELTEEIEAYLRNTPENTNNAILEELLNSTPQSDLVFEFDGNFTYQSGNLSAGVDNREDIYPFLSKIKNGDKSMVTVGNHTASGKVTIQDYHGAPLFTCSILDDNFIKAWNGTYRLNGEEIESSGISVTLHGETAITEHIKIEIID